MGNLVLNVLRMMLALVFGMAMFWVVTGSPLPLSGSWQAYSWMLLSGIVGYVIGDYCLFQCYIIIGSRFGQLFMTLAPLAAAITAWISLGEQMTLTNILAMLVTLLGIAISVLGRDEKHHVSLKLPLNGILFAIGAAICQGVGLVMSKIGMTYYETSVPAQEAWLLPFSANFFRCIAGLIGFTLLLYYKEGFTSLKKAMHNRVSITTAVTTTIFGPFVGVGFSLMAVQYTGAGIASTLMALTPIIIILPSYWLYHQPVTLKGVLGAIISCVGVSMFFLF